MQSEIYNTIDQPNFNIGICHGWQSLAEDIAHKSQMNLKQQAYCVGIDGYIGVDWAIVSKCVRKALGNIKSIANISIISTGQYIKKGAELSSIYTPYIGNDDPIFGRMFRKDLSYLFTSENKKNLCNMIISSRKKLGSKSVIVCIGSGALLSAFSDLFDFKIYLDMTREKATKSGILSTEGQSNLFSSKQIYYVDFPSNDLHRKKIIGNVDMYADGSKISDPVFIPQKTLQYALKYISSVPFRLKPIYESGVWGGQWLIRQRKLDGIRNCAYGLEIIAPEQSLYIKINEFMLDIPFTLVKDSFMTNLMEESTIKKFHGEFPIRFAYDDTWEGGNLSIQVHPTTEYIKANFGERQHQAETYYIFDAKPGSIVHLGLQEDIDKKKFSNEVRQSEKNNVTIDYSKFVQSHEAKKGDLFLIPAGTVHGAGANEIVLEISTTPYRYTFKIYDYRRPDLNGAFRPLSLGHAFNVINYSRKGSQVRENLIAKQEVLRTGEGFVEYILLDRREFEHCITRITFDTRYYDSTCNGFHILNLVEGEIVAIRRKNDSKNIRTFAFSETILIPKAFGDYEIVNLGTKPCAVLKSYIRGEKR